MSLSCRPVQNGSSSSPVGSKRQYIKRLWKAFFANPTEWWDYRLFKRNVKAPDFQHKVSQDKLWLDGTRNPGWVYPLLAKRDRECPCPPYAVPAQMLEVYKKEAAPAESSASRAAVGKPSLKKQTKAMRTSSGSNTESRASRQKKKSQVYTVGESSVREVLKKNADGISGEVLTAVGSPKLKRMKMQKSIGDNSETHAMQSNKNKRCYAVGEISILEKQKKKVVPTVHNISRTNIPAIGKINSIQNKKMQTDEGDLETGIRKSRKGNKGYTVGKVCDWHRLSVEDSLHALEKGLFSEPSVETLVHIVCKCTKMKDIRYAMLLFEYLQRNGLEAHDILGNYIVSMFVEVDNILQARLVFDKLAKRNECTWNSLIMGYSKSGESQQVIDLYKVMRQDQTLHLSEYAFVALLKACTSLRDAKTGRLVHADAAMDGLLKSNIFVGNALLDMYSKCGSLSEAQDVFNMLPARNVITWTSLIAGYAQHDRWIAALKCFKSMQDSGVVPNAFTFSLVLKVCGSLKNSAMGMELHTQVEEEGFLTSSQIVGNALVDMYTKCGLLAKAQEVFDLLPAHDVVTWNALITGYTDHAYFREAIFCLDKMKAVGVSPNAITFSSCLKACANIRTIEKGEEIHAEIRARGLIEKDVILGSSLVDMYAKCGLLDKAKEVFMKLPVQDDIAWTSLIAGYTQHDNCEKALACFRRMRSKGAKPDAVAYASALRACSSIGAISTGNKIYEDIDREGLIEKHSSLGNAVVDMFTKFGMLAKAQEVFMAIPLHDVVSWTALITGCAQLGEAGKAFYIFHKMREEWVNPTSVTILAILHACANQGMVDSAVSLVKDMREDCCVIPTLEHCTCLIDLLGRVGQITRAMTLVFEMPFYPEVAMWLALLGACQKWDHLKLAAVAFEHVMLLDESKASAYVFLSNIYADVSMCEHQRMPITS